MKSYRTLSRLPLRTAKRVSTRPFHTRKMPLFPRAFVGSDPSFTPLFRLLDDFDTYSRGGEGPGNNAHHQRNHNRVFQPKFDVRELTDAYELHGELPGIDQKDIEIEFNDPQTLTVRGRVERIYTSGTTPSHLVEGQKSSGTITDSNEKTSHKATVEDEDAAKKSSSVVQTGQAKEKAPQQDDQAKYWASERSIGEFARSFNFPARVDQDNVKAGIRNGILTITVPKAKKQAARKIEIN